MKDKKVNIALIVISVIVFCICLFIILNTSGKPASEITILKDIEDEEVRVIEDKTDVYNNSDEVLHIKSEMPEGTLNPNEVFKEFVTEPIERGENNGQVDAVYKPNNNNGELRIPEPGEDIVIVEEVIEEEEEFIPISLDYMLYRLREYRNQDFILSDGNALLFTLNRESVQLLDYAREKPIVIIPFSSKNPTQLKYVADSVGTYNACKDSVNFVYLNTCIEREETPSEIRNALIEQGITEELPVYYDDFQSILVRVRDAKYVVLNSDAFIIHKGYDKVNEKTINLVIKDYEDLMDKHKAQEEELTKFYEERVIDSYPVLDVYVEHIVDGTPLSVYLDENGDLKEKNTETIEKVNN